MVLIALDYDYKNSQIHPVSSLKLFRDKVYPGFLLQILRKML